MSLHRYRVVLLGLILPCLPFLAHAEPPNLGLLTQQVIAYHDSGDYENDVAFVIHKAQLYLAKRIAENDHREHRQKLALVLDIDETSLSNYNNMSARGFAVTKEQLHQEILKADEPALAPTLSLFHYAKSHGVAIFFITGRHESEREATVQNLTNAGYRGWSGLFLKPDDYDKPSASAFKAHIREQLTQKGYTIVASIGDQPSDFIGGFAEKTFKLPNPYYYLP